MTDNGTIENSNQNEIDLKKLLSVLFRHKWKVIGLTLLGLTAAWGYAYMQQAVYESEGALIITESQQRSLGSGDLTDLLASTYGVGLGSRIANELLVLRSRQLSMVLADKLIEEDLMENGRRFPLLWNEFQNDSTVATREQVAMRIRKNLHFDRMEREADVVKISFRSYSPIEAQWMVNQAIDSYSEISTEQNRMAASAALQFLEKERIETERRLSEAQEKFRDFMSSTGLVQIDSQTNMVIDRISDLESRRQELQTRLVSVNVGMETYEKQLNQIMPGLAERYAESVAPTLDRYQFRLAELETERLLYITRNPALRNNPQMEPELQNINEQIIMLKEEINSLASQLIGESGDEFLSFLSSSDGNIAARITDIRNRLIELQVEQAQMMAQLQAIAERLEIENQFFDDLPDNMVELASHRRDVQINENLYETISRQYAEMALWEQTQFGLGRPLDYGFEPAFPVEPRMPVYMLIGLMVGFICGASLGVILENNNYRIDGVEKLQKSGFPVLSVIPDQLPYVKKYFKRKKKVEMNERIISVHWLTQLQAHSPITEAYRRLHTNIIYSHPDEQLDVLLVSSCSKGEGKTTIAVNLATVLAESGKKVLLLDLDLRRPAVHAITGEDREPGVKEILFDGLPLTHAVRDTGIEGLSVLTAGKQVPNPSSVMQSKKLINLIYNLKVDYDHIVIDTAPVGIITDAVPIICLADGVIMAVRFGATRKQELHQTLDRLARIRANVLGTVLAYYKHKSSADYHYINNLQYFYNYDKYEEYQSEVKSGYT